MNQFNSQLSLYIPRITPEWADEDAISSQFHHQDIGLVERVDLIHKIGENGKEYYQGFIHFKEWYESAVAYNIQERINDPERQARLVYDDPWYWMLLRNTKPRTETERRLEARINALEQVVSDSHGHMLNKIYKYMETTDANIDTLKCHLYDLELEYQAILHSDVAAECGINDYDTVIENNWDDVSIGGMTAPTHTNKSSYSPICFNTVDDDREIEAWEDKHRITPDAHNLSPPELAAIAPYRSLSELDRHSAECMQVVDNFLGRDGWCDP